MEGSCATGGPAAAACKKIAIFGATGMTGLATLAQALEAGEAGQRASTWAAEQTGDSRRAASSSPPPRPGCERTRSGHGCFPREAPQRLTIGGWGWGWGAIENRRSSALHPGAAVCYLFAKWGWSRFKASGSRMPFPSWRCTCKLSHGAGATTESIIHSVVSGNEILV